MTGIRLDHIITYTSAECIDSYLKEYAALGFVPAKETVRHDPGLRNGFVFIGPEYVEFCWVEDETLFEEASAQQRLLCATPRPFGLGVVAWDVGAVHDDWTARGYELPEVSSSAPRDAPADSPPVWSFQMIPEELLLGAWCFVLTYHRRSKDKATEITIGPNTIYAISGLTFVAPEPEVRATSWRDLLAPEEAVKPLSHGYCVQIGAHRAAWMKADHFTATYGLDWVPFPQPVGEVAMLHMLASDLSAAKTTLEQSGRQTSTVIVGVEEALLVAPDPRDGLVFTVQQQPVEEWLQERKAKTGETLEVVQG